MELNSFSPSDTEGFILLDTEATATIDDTNLNAAGFQSQTENTSNINELKPVNEQTASTTAGTTSSTASETSVASSTEVTTDTNLPVANQGDTAIRKVEVTVNASASKVIRDSLGLTYQGPVVEKLIDKVINLALNQVPGYKEVNSAISTTNTVVQIGDILTNVGLSPVETAVELAKLLSPQVRLAVTGFNIVSSAVEALNPASVQTTDSLYVTPTTLVADTNTTTVNATSVNVVNGVVTPGSGSDGGIQSTPVPPADGGVYKN